MKKVAVLLSLTALLVVSLGAVCGASSMYGLSGLIETPDDTVAATNTLSLSGSFIPDFNDTNFDISTYGGAFGIIPNLEIGAVAVDSSATGVGAQAVLSAKYKIVPETLDGPSIAFGVVDVTNRLDRIDSRIDEASYFVVIGKNISSLAEGFSGMVSKPVRGTLGIGTGLYKGIFAGIDLHVAPKFDVAVEYLSEGLRQEGTFNAALRFRPVNNISVQAGTYAFKGAYIAGSVMLSTY